MGAGIPAGAAVAGNRPLDSPTEATAEELGTTQFRIGFNIA